MRGVADSVKRLSLELGGTRTPPRHRTPAPSTRPLRITAREENRLPHAQRRYAETLAAGDAPLRIVSELVALGSPLSKADILIGHDVEDLSDRIARREIPSASPVIEAEGEDRRFSHPLGLRRGTRITCPVFGPTAWAIVYHPHRLIISLDGKFATEPANLTTPARL